MNQLADVLVLHASYMIEFQDNDVGLAAIYARALT